MKAKRVNLALTFILIILGLLLSTSFYSRQKTIRTNPISRKNELIEVIGDLEKKRDSLKLKLDDLRKKVSSYEKRAAFNEGELKSFNADLSKLKKKAGLTTIEGKGLKVTLSDNPKVPPGKDPNNYIIHDYDLRAVVNALWQGEAEAIAVNNQRLTSFSAIRCVGTTILTNFVRLATPYEIKALGDPNKLEKSLKENKQVTLLLNNYAKTYGLKVSIKKVKNLEIPTYKGSLKVEYAQATSEE